MIHGPSVTSGTSLNLMFLKSSWGNAPGSCGSGQEISEGIFQAVEEEGAGADSGRDPSWEDSMLTRSAPSTAEGSCKSNINKHHRYDQ